MRVRVRARGEGTEGDGRPGRRWRGGVCYPSSPLDRPIHQLFPFLSLSVFFSPFITWSLPLFPVFNLDRTTSLIISSRRSSSGRSIEFTGIIQLVQIHFSGPITQKIQIQIQIPLFSISNPANTTDNNLIIQIQLFLVLFQTMVTIIIMITWTIPFTVKNVGCGRTPCRGQLKHWFRRLNLERCCRCWCKCSRCAALLGLVGV